MRARIRAVLIGVIVLLGVGLVAPTPAGAITGGQVDSTNIYENVGIMDAPTTVFEVHAGDLDKTVRVLAVDFEEPQPGPVRRHRR